MPVLPNLFYILKVPVLVLNENFVCTKRERLKSC